MLNSVFCIPASHPCLADHFPGHPIAPGVLTLDLVAQGLLEQLTGVTLAGFPQVKFLQPVLPGQEIKVSYALKKDELYQFSCTCGDRVLVTGQIRLAREDAVLG
ncbi:MAG: MaoC/PaaZ C-terminal domain-containing protein [Gammaproteobacteria bacterium]|jgi:3-hydroxyacyl-[acyl-carrier-protein] dehydratase